MKKETLIIVDFQNDFCNPNGALYVKGAEEAKTSLINYLETNKDNIDNVILTRDWHKLNDASFINNGGTWPIHCVEGSWGANIDDTIINALDNLGINYSLSNKGTNPKIEEYGAFTYICEGKNNYELKNNDDNYINIIPKTINTITICGIAGDYCVYETAKNLYNSGFFEIKIFKDGIASIDGGKKINNFIVDIIKENC